MLSFTFFLVFFVGWILYEIGFLRFFLHTSCEWCVKLTTDGIVSRGIHKTNWFQNGYIDPYPLRQWIESRSMGPRWDTPLEVKTNTHNTNHTRISWWYRVRKQNTACEIVKVEKTKHLTAKRCARWVFRIWNVCTNCDVTKTDFEGGALKHWLDLGQTPLPILFTNITLIGILNASSCRILSVPIRTLKQHFLGIQDMIKTESAVLRMLCTSSKRFHSLAWNVW